MIDKNSNLGQAYEKIKQENPFYCHAHFYSVNEILDMLHKASFKETEIYQTLFSPLENIQSPEVIKSGFGSRGFVAIIAF